MYFDEQSKVPSFFGYACTHLVLSSFIKRPQFGGRFLDGLPEALSPPPVQLVTVERWLIMHWRVRVDPQALASVAHRRKEEVACSPSWEVRPPYFLTIARYWATAGTTLAASSGS